METLEWLQTWYKSQCNGDWEHSSGIKICTIDNPGWSITIDLEDTELENIEINWIKNEASDTDWFHYKIENKKFDGRGDDSKLKILLEKFREIVNQNSK